MGNAITLDSLALWRQMRADGGWWTPRGLVRHWAPTFALWEVEELLAGLVNGGYLMAREVSPRELSYAFTSECQVLPGELAPTERETQ